MRRRSGSLHKDTLRESFMAWGRVQFLPSTWRAASWGLFEYRFCLHGSTQRPATLHVASRSESDAWRLVGLAHRTAALWHLVGSVCQSSIGATWLGASSADFDGHAHVLESVAQQKVDQKTLVKDCRHLRPTLRGQDLVQSLAAFRKSM